MTGETAAMVGMEKVQLGNIAIIFFYNLNVVFC